MMRTAALSAAIALAAASPAVALALAAASPATAQEPALATVLDRAAAYVADFHRQLSGVVAEERYVQEVKAFAQRPRRLPSPMRSELHSDLLLVRPVGGGEWTEFRDVFEVNGLAVRDRSDRLTRLFLDGSSSARAQIGRILDESSRFNIGEIARNINTPVFALQILERANQGRFRFKRTSDRVPATLVRESSVPGAFRTGTEVWTVEFQEKRSGTLIRTDKMRDLPSSGRFWIDPYTGRVLMSELVAKNRDVTATVDVSYQSEPLVGFLVPVEMRENYRYRRGARVEGIAEYGRFRQFQVNVDETFFIKK
jgi:hypothetical protein